MAKAKVKVIVYTKKSYRYGYGYENPDLISEEQYEELVANREEELAKDEGAFEDYLADNYSWKEVFEMNEDEKAKVCAEYADKCSDWAREDLEEYWDYEEIETEVEIPFTPPKGECLCSCPCNR